MAIQLLALLTLIFVAIGTATYIELVNIGLIYTW